MTQPALRRKSAALQPRGAACVNHSVCPSHWKLSYLAEISHFTRLDKSRLSPILGTLPRGRHGPSSLAYHFRHFHMKIIKRHLPFAWSQATRGQALQLALALGVVIFATGCGKKESPAPAATNPAANTPDAAQQTTQPTPQGAVAPPATPLPVQTNLGSSANGDGDVTALQQLNRAVIGFRMQHHRNPNSVEEISSASGIQLPPPPPGKKYAFNSRGLITLVDSSAK